MNRNRTQQKPSRAIVTIASLLVCLVLAGIVVFRYVQPIKLLSASDISRIKSISVIKSYFSGASSQTADLTEDQVLAFKKLALNREYQYLGRYTGEVSYEDGDIIRSMFTIFYEDSNKQEKRMAYSISNLGNVGVEYNMSLKWKEYRVQGSPDNKDLFNEIDQLIFPI